MSAEDRDPKFERALAQHLRSGSAPSRCPDAETLAAYHERSLSLDEMGQWKQHIAGCAACQKTLSLVEMTEKQLAEDWEKQKIPVLETAAAPLVRDARRRAAKAGAGGGATASEAAAALVAEKRRPVLIRWGLPLGAVAAGLLVWIGIHEQHLMRAPALDNIQVAENRQPSLPASTPYETAPQPAAPSPRERDEVLGKPGAQVSQNAPPSAAASARKTTRGRRLTAPAGDVLQKDEAALKKQPTPDVNGIAGGSGAGNGIAPAAAPAAPQAPPPSPKASAKEQPPGLMNEAVEVNAAAPPVNRLDTVELPNGQGGNATKDQKHVAAMSKSKSAMQQSASADTNAMAYKQGINGREINSLNNLAPWVGVILTPDQKVWWKITGPGTVELTTDAGKKWKTVETGVRAQLASGSAPSAKVCWIAGQAGTLLLTTDRGGHWAKLTTPITGDLGGVHAADAKHATIWDTANRLSYQTSDGGATWKQVANE